MQSVPLKPTPWSASDDDAIRHGKHRVFKRPVHGVFVAKYRRRVFDGDAIERLRRLFAGACANREAGLMEMDSKNDPVAPPGESPPKLPVPMLVNGLKGVCLAGCRAKERPDLK